MGVRGVWAAANEHLIVAYFCGDSPYFLPRSKFIDTPLPRSNFHKTSAHRVASDVATRHVALERAPKGHRRQKWRWRPHPRCGEIPLIFHQSENVCIPPPLARISPKKAHRALPVMWRLGALRLNGRRRATGGGRGGGGQRPWFLIRFHIKISRSVGTLLSYFCCNLSVTIFLARASRQ
jgi:hypothetical protein